MASSPFEKSNPGALDEEPDHWTRLGAPLLLCVLLGLFYAPAVLAGPYLFADDYLFRYLAERNELGWFDNPFTQMGRPLSGLFNVLTFKSLEEIADYAWIRAFGLLGTMVCAWRIYRVGRQHAWGTGALLALEILLFTNPAWAVLIGWASCSTYPWAALLAFEGGRQMVGAADVDMAPPSPSRWIGGCLLAIISMTIYQITIAFALVPFLLRLPCRQSTPWRSALAVWIGTSIAYLSSFALIKLLQATLFAEGNPALNRDGFVTDPVQRLKDLQEHVLPRTAELWASFLPPAGAWIMLGWLVAVGLFMAFLVCFKESLGKRIWNLTVFGLPCLGLAAAPLLVLAENSFPWRILAGTFAISILLGAIFVLPGQTGRPPNRLARLAFAGGWGWLIFQYVWGAFVFAEGFVLPNVRETSDWKRQLEAQFKERPPSFTYLLPDDKPISLTKIPRDAEYGSSSASYGWVASSALNVYFDELFPESNRFTLSQTAPNTFVPSSEIDPAFVVEGWKIVHPDSPPSETTILQSRPDPFLGDVDVFGRQWGRTSIGIVNWSKWPWIMHLSLGWMLVEPERSRDGVIHFLGPADRKPYSLGLNAPETIREETSGRSLTYHAYLEKQRNANAANHSLPQ